MNQALCLLSLSLLGCFEVATVDPGNEVEPFLVDDFESADRLPEPPFQQWACRAFQPEDDPAGVDECAFKAGNGSPWAFMGAFTLRDERDQVTDDVSASLSTNATRSLDLRRYREVLLDLKFRGLDVAVANGSNFYVKLTCQSARSGGIIGGGGGEPLAVIREVRLIPNSWVPLRLALDAFRKPTWQEDFIDGGDEACLARVDSIAFLMSTNVGDGGTGQAELYIDDVSFE